MNVFSEANQWRVSFFLVSVSFVTPACALTTKTVMPRRGRSDMIIILLLRIRGRMWSIYRRLIIISSLLLCCCHYSLLFLYYIQRRVDKLF